jgi:prepilin-type N-terminal cleavage/methylation domain-containing protein
VNTRRGFSLLEVLVALSVSAALLTLLLTMLVRVTSFWDRSASRLAVENQARLVLDQLEADFRAVVWRRDGGAWLIAAVQPDQPAIGGHAGIEGETWAPGLAGAAKPASAAGSLQLVSPDGNYRFGQAGVWLRLITNLPSEGEPRSVPAAVAYQLVRRAQADGAPPVYQLFRSRVTARATFGAGYDLENPAYSAPPYASGQPGTLRRPLVAELLANHVIDFGVRFSARESDGSERLLFPQPARLEYRADGSETAVPVAEVYVRILTGEGVRQIALLEYPNLGYTSGDDWWGIAEKHSMMFTRRLEFGSHPL